MRRSKILFLSILTAVLGMGVFGGITTTKEFASKPVEMVEAATVSKTRIVLEIEDQTKATQSDTGGGNPVVRLFDITVDSSMGFDTSSQANLFNDLDAAGVINDFETGASSYRAINKTDKWIETSFTWGHEGNNGEGKWCRWWNLRIPWYITGFGMRVRCGSLDSDNNSTITAHGSYMVYLWANGHGGNWYSQSVETGSSISNTYNVNNYTISTAKNGGGSSTVQVKGNGGSYVSSGSYFTRQKIELKATAATGYVFSSWDYGKSTSSATNYDYVGTAAKTYTATFGNASGRYIAGTFPAGTSDDWTVGASVFMTNTAVAGEYSGTVTLAFGDLVKTPYYNGSAFEYNMAYDSFNSLLPSAAAYYCFGDNGGDNHEIKCYAAGSYTFYFKDSAYDGSHKISVAYNGDLTAQHLAAKLMNFTEYAGHCGDNDRFPAMKTIFLGLSSSEKTAFQGYASSGTTQFKNAYDRYVAWASALGENPWAEGKLSSNLAFLSVINSDNASSSLTIIIISSVTVLSVVGYFVIKKKKQR